MSEEGDTTSVTITIRPVGPFLVRGPVTLVQPDGTEIVPPVGKTPGVIKLCSCGFSESKPFCDASHKRCPPPPTTAAPPVTD